MTELPPITLVMTTWAPGGREGYARAQAARACLDTWRHRLHYEGELRLHVADDGSGILDYPYSLGRDIEWAVSFSRQERRGVGASLNAGFEQAHEGGGLALYVVDDWMLLWDIDLTPWAALLERDPTIGMVRLGPPHPWLTGTVEHLGELGWCLRLERHHFAFAHRPALYHPRMRAAYGWFAEGVTAYDCERLYSEEFNRWSSMNVPQDLGSLFSKPIIRGGPDIVMAIIQPWHHVSGPEQGDIVPEGLLQGAA